MNTRSTGEELTLLPKQSTPWLISSGIKTDLRGIPASATFLRAADAPEAALDLLWHCPRNSADIFRTQQTRVRRCGDFVLKTMHDRMTVERWDRIMGSAALTVNLALQEGLNEHSKLESGYTIVTPRYYGAILFPGRRAAKWVMSYERGEKVHAENRGFIGNESDRRSIYDNALNAVGITTASTWYDDGEHNLLVRSEEKEVVKLDALSAISYANLCQVDH